MSTSLLGLLMPNEIFNSAGIPTRNTTGSMAQLASEFARIAAGFDLFPLLAGNVGKVLGIQNGSFIATPPVFNGVTLLAETGYYRFPGENGLILQWMTIEGAAPFSVATFPVAFPNAFLGGFGCADQIDQAEALALTSVGIDLAGSTLTRANVHARTKTALPGTSPAFVDQGPLRLLFWGY